MGTNSDSKYRQIKLQLTAEPRFSTVVESFNQITRQRERTPVGIDFQNMERRVEQFQ
jgi:hypothetical protein